MTAQEAEEGDVWPLSIHLTRLPKNGEGPRFSDLPWAQYLA